MATLIHYSPLGSLVLPGVPGPVAPGEPFEVDDTIAASLLQQADVYQPARIPSIRELRELAAAAGIDPTGMSKNDLVAALAAAASSQEAPQ